MSDRGNMKRKVGVLNFKDQSGRIQTNLETTIVTKRKNFHFGPYVRNMAKLP